MKKNKYSLSAGIDKETRARVYKRDGYRCALCDDSRRIQAHHVVFRSQGGPDTEMNLITLCPRCHAAAHGTDIDRLGLTPQYMEQVCTQYLSDLYAEKGIIWSPWSPETHEWKF